MKDKQNKINRSYARALYDAAEAAGVLERLQRESAMLADIWEEDKNIKKYLSNPAWDSSHKEKALEIIADKNNLSQPLRGLFKVVAANSRIGNIAGILRDFIKVYYKRQNISPVTVYSAIEMSNSQKQRLIQAMEKYTGGRVEVKYKLKPELLGGLLIECKTELIDDSVSGKLERIEMLMKGGI
ncbi:MAG: ATP synthase F1 subunit delta [Alphaproteobacteria bacterium]|nr:ATP synthase F1 subunit delta [Alphaproteobacteria bacterium]